MALTATIYRFAVELNDVDRGVFASLDVRMARHPSETERFLLLRLLAWCLEHTEGIAFSPGGLSSTDEPPLSVRDATGQLLAWIDIGAPAADRLHKASKAAARVALYTVAELATLRREMASRPVHRLADIEVYVPDLALIDALQGWLQGRRSLELGLTRSDGELYVHCDGRDAQGALTLARLT